MNFPESSVRFGATTFFWFSLSLIFDEQRTIKSSVLFNCLEKQLIDYRYHVIFSTLTIILEEKKYSLENERTIEPNKLRCYQINTFYRHFLLKFFIYATFGFVVN
ncbi:hypothetical protein RIR_jg21483.t1 [Rhizophagus irregularis DAOM 181602=DAOM 197198]|nr:hypothetical protein RIR_jg21483.t1 [Rhizophagus irregularis DAOM 181602=DAOM 197198]